MNTRKVAIIYFEDLKKEVLTIKGDNWVKGKDGSWMEAESRKTEDRDKWQSMPLSYNCRLATA